MSKNVIAKYRDAREILIHMAEGNPGVMRVMMDILENTKAIDPQCVLGGVVHLGSLDFCGIYGSHIWILYKDRCGESLPKLLALIRAFQLGYISKEDLVEMSIDYPPPPGGHISDADLDLLIGKVKQRLPALNLEWSR